MGGKESEFKNQEQFVAIDQSTIYKVDPRMSKFIINKKDYKTDVGFNKITTAKNDSFVIGSDNGELRFFQDPLKIAKNLIPSYLGHQVEFIDSTQDNSLLLVTFSSYLMLLNVEQGNQSLFETTFK